MLIQYTDNFFGDRVLLSNGIDQAGLKLAVLLAQPVTVLELQERVTTYSLKFPSSKISFVPVAQY